MKPDERKAFHFDNRPFHFGRVLIKSGGSSHTNKFHKPVLINNL